MRRLKKGDICPLCGEPIETSDPFTLGYLSAWAELTASPGESPGEDGPVNCGASGPDPRSRKESGHEY